MEEDGRAIVIMGVSGCGKSTIAKKLADSLSCCFLEADDFHSVANKEKMSKGVPLTDDDRIPWLESLAAAISKEIMGGQMVVVACSALQLKYRDILRSADRNYSPGAYSSCRVEFICVQAPMDLIAERIRRRSADGNHFMPVTLLQSQFSLLQLDEAEKIPKIDGIENLETISDRLFAQYQAKLSRMK